MTIIIHEVNSIAIGQRPEDGYINLTSMTQASGKQVGHYLENQSTTAFLEELSSDIGIPIDQLVARKMTGPNSERGTWAHPQVAIHCGQWCSPRFAVLVSKWVFEWMTSGKTPEATPLPEDSGRDSLLAQLEADIERGLNLIEQGKYLVWQAVARIQSEKLWRLQGFANFEEYCQERWGWQKTNANEIARAGRVVTQLQELGVQPNQLPTAVSQIRPLLEIEPDRRAEVWLQTLESNSGRRITTEVIKRVTRQQIQQGEADKTLMEMRSVIDECRLLFRLAGHALARMDEQATRRYLGVVHSSLAPFTEQKESCQ